jgi:ubiquinone/menaquinone biosynthesis C-methylase UbiE
MAKKTGKKTKNIKETNTIVTTAYNDDWQKKLKEKGRLALQERVYMALHRLFRDILHEPFKGDVLDVGAGDGSIVKVFNRHPGMKAKGVDISDGVNFETDKLPFKNNSFDIAIMYAVIEHLHDAGNILGEIRRVLRKKGKIIIITSNVDLSHLLICDRQFYNDPTHVHPYTPTSIEHLLRLYHFRKRFIGVWTIPKYSLLWKMPSLLQFYIGALLPFRGNVKYAPFFLKGKSKSMLCVFENGK